MKRYEKILIIFILLLFAGQFLPYFMGKSALSAIGFLFVASSYLIGGYWLLNFKNKKEHIIPILSGIAFATSLSVLPFIIRLGFRDIFKILPLLNLGLFLGLSVYLLIKKNLFYQINIKVF